MKIALIIGNNIWFCPFLAIYTKLLKEWGIEYDIISWNRDGLEKPEGIQYNKQIKLRGRFTKFIPYLLYIKFVKETIKKEKYDKLIVFSPQIAIFMFGFLRKFYKNRYIFDYRDLSIEQSKIFKYPFHSILKYSYANIISSPGFKRCLPNQFRYILSHNFNIDLVRKAIAQPITEPDELPQIINVLTIGGIRDYSSNIEVIKALANKTGFQMQFVGKGPATQLIQQYVGQAKINNTTFEGYYSKEKEGDYINQCSYLNIFYPAIISHATALSNRFYNALIYKKPMIVTANSIQGDYVEKYQIGLALHDCKDLDKKLNTWIQNIDYKIFSKQCNNLLTQFLKDYNIFSKTLSSFLQSY